MLLSLSSKTTSELRVFFCHPVFKDDIRVVKENNRDIIMELGPGADSVALVFKITTFSCCILPYLLSSVCHISISAGVIM